MKEYKICIVVLVYQCDAYVREGLEHLVKQLLYVYVCVYAYVRVCVCRDILSHMTCARASEA